MKHLFPFLVLLLSPLKASDRCNCGTSWDVQVDQIGKKICEFLVDIDLFMPPEGFWAFNYAGDEDEEIWALR